MSDKETSLRVRHLPGYGVDPDLAAFDGDLSVTLATIEPYVDDLTHDVDKARSFEAMYRAHGPWALPPVLCVGDVNWQVGGGHRVEAAYRAGLPWIPAFVIDGPTPLYTFGDDR